MTTIDLIAYIQQCAPRVTPSTMLAIIKTESGGNMLAINVNGKARLLSQPKNIKQALAWVEYLDKYEYNFDIGLCQVNIRNVRKYGYKPSDMLDPCKNLIVASDILYKNYHKVLNNSNSKNYALQKALSAYNTGNYHRGFVNGYVQRVLANSMIVVTDKVQASRY